MVFRDWYTEVTTFLEKCLLRLARSRCEEVSLLSESMTNPSFAELPPDDCIVAVSQWVEGSSDFAKKAISIPDLRLIGFRFSIVADRQFVELDAQVLRLVDEAETLSSFGNAAVQRNRADSFCTLRSTEQHWLEWLRGQEWVMRAPIDELLASKEIEIVGPGASFYSTEGQVGGTDYGPRV